MVDDVQEGLKSNTTLSNVTVEESDTNDDVTEFAELSYLLWCG